MINKLGIMKKGKVWRKVAFALGMLVFLQGQAQKRTFVHPGITYTQADLDRMKAMVEARQEPFYTTFQHMLKDGYSQIGDGNYADITQIKEGNSMEPLEPTDAGHMIWHCFTILRVTRLMQMMP